MVFNETFGDWWNSIFLLDALSDAQPTALKLKVKMLMKVV